MSALTVMLDQATISQSKESTINWFPQRPAFGTQGTSVVLWTNYFELNTSAKVPLLKYSLEVIREQKDPKGDEKEEGPKEGKKGKRKGDKKKNDGPKGGKLHTIIKSALEQIAGSKPYATEFKDQVISIEPFVLPDDRVVRVKYLDEGKDDTFKVTFKGPVTVDVPSLLTYLQTMRDPTGSMTYPKFEEAIDAISIITGYHARSNSSTSAVGRSRYFPLTLQGEQYDMGYPDFNRIIRGYFQSARPATGRLILNANVAHGAFRPKGFVSNLVEVFNHDYFAMHKSLAGLRARCTILSDNKDLKTTRVVQKVICGLADTRDGSRENPAQVNALGAAANNVKFRMRAPAPAGLQANAFCSVADYYKKSRTPPVLRLVVV